MNPLDIKLYNPDRSYNTVKDLIENDAVKAMLSSPNEENILAAEKEAEEYWEACLVDYPYASMSNRARGRYRAIECAIALVKGDIETAKRQAILACVWDCRSDCENDAKEYAEKQFSQ